MSATNRLLPLTMTARDWLLLALVPAVGMAVTLPWLPIALWPP
jgi:hypothetical protein